jgi:hypothetical protein
MAATRQPELAIVAWQTPERFPGFGIAPERQESHGEKMIFF